MQLTYDPKVFDVTDLAKAMQIILTPEGSTTERRWQLETPYVTDLISQSIKITPETVLLDYGCGVGRMARALIERHGCSVVGVDISPNMRALAAMYVKSDRFFACPPAMLANLLDRGMRFDAAISIWVLQHCLKPADDIGSLRRALKPDAGLFVLNNLYRALPVDGGWASDGLEIKQMLSSQFTLQRTGRLPLEVAPEQLVKVTFWASFLNRPPRLDSIPPAA
jgi:cyclopropane fatty-acyl-phospholipid synthase-like methyltransferase